MLTANTSLSAATFTRPSIGLYLYLVNVIFLLYFFGLPRGIISWNSDSRPSQTPSIQCMNIYGGFREPRMVPRGTEMHQLASREVVRLIFAQGRKFCSAVILGVANNFGIFGEAFSGTFLSYLITVHTEKSFRNFIESNRNQIVFTKYNTKFQKTIFHPKNFLTFFQKI